MKNWTIARRLAAGFAAVIVISVALGVFALVQILTIKRTTEYMSTDPYPGTVAIYEIQSGMLANFGRVGTFLMASPDEKSKIAAEIAGARDQLDKAFHEYDITITTAEDRAMFDTLKTHRAEFVTAFSEIIQSSTAGHNDEAIAKARKELPAMISTITTDDLGKLVKFNRDNAERALGSIGTSVGHAVHGLVVGEVCAMLTALVAAWVLVVGVNRLLKGVAETMDTGACQVAAASSQVSASSQTLAEGSSEQAASIQETSASLEEITTMIKRTAENTQKANDLAKSARGAADGGMQDVQTMLSAMEEIKSSSDDVAKIIKTIDEIAFQTNILALNAAVEAARAGEAGMGFAVVADEVRNLAQRSAQAAKETAGKIEGAIAKTGQGVAVSGKVSQTLTEIAGKVRQLDELVAEVTQATQEQSQGIAQLSVATGQMDKVTQSNAATAEETAAAAEELNSQAAVMKSAVADLSQLLGKVEKAGVSNSGVQARRVAAPMRASATATPRLAKNIVRNKPVTAPSRAPVNKSAIPLEDGFKEF